MSHDPTSNSNGSFSDLVQAALNRAVTPDAVQAKVDKAVSDMVDSTISDALGRWSDTGKAIKAAVTDSLRVGDGLNLPSYGNTVCQILEAQIQARVSEVVAAKLQEDMEKLLTLAPKAVKLSDLIEQLLEGEDDPCSCEPTSISMHLEYTEYRGARLYIHSESPAPSHHYEYDIRLYFTLLQPTKNHTSDEVPAGTIHTGNVKGTDLKKDIQFGYGSVSKAERRHFGRWFAFEQKILSMYAVGTVITLDEDCCVLSRWDD